VPKDNNQTPIPVTRADVAFGGASGLLSKILPPYSAIPDEFKRGNSPWAEWQRQWFFDGLDRYPVPKEGIDLGMAMANLQVVQNSFAPKHEHKEAGVAYLASLWFSSPDGELTNPKKSQQAA
jgi:hypothetical protein